VIIPEYISGRPFSVQILLENLLESSGAIKLIKDGAATGSLRYTRDYRVYINGKKTAAKVRFTYNKREDWADITISYYDLMELKFSELTEGIHNERIQVFEPARSEPVRNRNAKVRSEYDSKESKRVFDRIQEGERQTQQAKRVVESKKT
jgi:hypothetical protein